MIEVLLETIVAAFAKFWTEAISRKVHAELPGRKGSRVPVSESALRSHLRFVANWSNQIKFNIKSQRKIADSFVDLDLEPGRQARRDFRREEHKIKVSHLLRLSGNVVLVGDPGAGKTTSLQYLAFSILTGGKPNPTHGPPLLVEFRSLRSDDCLYSAILEAFGIGLDDSMPDEKARLHVAIRILDDTHARLFLDGLDELHIRARDRILRQVRQILNYSGEYRVFITCRTAEASMILFENCVTYAIEPLTKRQVELFAKKWLGERPARELLEKVRGTPYDGAEVLPLTLAQLCTYFEHKSEIPPKPRTIYRKIVRLLLEEWDEQRSVHRCSMYANFESDRKEEFLCAIAYALTLRPSMSRSESGLAPTDRQISFDETQLKRAYRAICGSFGLLPDECQRVIREIESHTGLIVQIDADRYEFAHRSIQEYFVAQQILRQATLPHNVAALIPGEMGLVVALSSDANGYFYLIVESALKSRQAAAAREGRTQPAGVREFAFPFLRRIYLEAVDFKPAELLGRRLIELYSLIFFPRPSQLQMQLPFDPSSRIFRDFAKLGGVWKSLQLALGQARLESNGGGTVRAIWNDTDKVEELFRAGAVVDTGFVDWLGSKEQRA